MLDVSAATVLDDSMAGMMEVLKLAADNESTEVEDGGGGVADATSNSERP